MRKVSKIYVAGHNGMVGSAILRLLKSEGYSNIIILLSTLIEDVAYEDVIDQIKLRSKKAKIIVYSSFASIEEITTLIPVKGEPPLF